MKGLLIIVVVALLPGCAVTLHGNQTTANGSTATSTGSSVQAARQTGNTRFSGSFGAPPAAQATGGQVIFSRGGSALLVVGLVVAGTVDAISDWTRPAAPRAERLPSGNISQTCSCYASNSELTSNPAAQ